MPTIEKSKQTLECWKLNSKLGRLVRYIYLFIFLILTKHTWSHRCTMQMDVGHVHLFLKSIQCNQGSKVWSFHGQFLWHDQRWSQTPLHNNHISMTQHISHMATNNCLSRWRHNTLCMYKENSLWKMFKLQHWCESSELSLLY